MSVKVGDYVDVDPKDTVGRISRFYPTTLNQGRASVFVEYNLGNVFKSDENEPTLQEIKKEVIRQIKKNHRGESEEILKNITKREANAQYEEAMRIFLKFKVEDSAKPIFPGKVVRIADGIVEVEYKNPFSLIRSLRESNVPNAPPNNENIVPKVSLKPVPGAGANTRRRRNRRARKTRRRSN